MRQKRHVFAVVRVDDFLGPDVPIEDKVNVKQIVATQEIAMSEVARLTRINARRGCRYFWQTTRFTEISEV